MKNFLIGLKSLGGLVIGGAAGSVLQVLSTGQTINASTVAQAKGAAISGALTTLLALFITPPHKAGAVAGGADASVPASAAKG